MSRQYFRKFMPEQSINSTDLSTTVAFNINSGKNDLMHFSNGRAFLLIKSTLARGDSLTTAAGNVRRTWNWPAGLFQTTREKLNGSTFAIVNNFTQTDSIVKRQRYSKSYLDTVGQLMGLNSDAERTTEKTNFRTVDTVFVPACMSTFGIRDLQPSSSLRLEFDRNPNYRTSCCENTTVGTNIDVGTSNTTYQFNIDSIELYVLVTEAATDIPRGVSSYELVEFKSQLISKDFASSVNEIVKVEPSVVSVFYALQHRDALSTTRWSPTKFQPFVVGGVAATDNAYNKMTQQYLKYNGIMYPENTNDFLRSTTDAETGYKLSFYMNLVYNQLLWNGSGAEGYDLFKSTDATGYGPYFAFDLEKDASVQATDVNIVMKFSPGTVSESTLVVVSSNTFTLQVAYDDNGNMTGMPVKTIQ